MNYKTYEKYRDSNIKWIGEIPEHWDFIPVNKFSTLITDYVANGSFASLKNNVEYLDEENHAILVRLVDNTNNFKGPFVYINKDSYNFLSKTKLKEGDIILANIGATLGTIFKVPDLGKPMSLGPNVLLVRFENDVNGDFFLKLIGSSIGKCFIDSITTQTTQPKFNKSELRKLRILHPPQNEQKLIVSYIDKKTAKIDATIAKNEELIQLLEEKRVALINQVVTKGLNPDVPMKDSGVQWIGKIPEHWDIDCLKHNVLLNTKTLTDTTDENYEFDYVDIGSVSLENGIEKYEHMYFVDAPSRARRIVKKDDVIISTVRTYLKAIAIIPDKENIIVSTGFAVLTPSKIDSRYLGYMVKTEYFTNLVSAHSVGVSYPAINSTDLVNLDILIPPEDEQKQIANYLDHEVSNINDIIIKVTENINLLEEYKTSLIHHVVTGKIDVRGEEI